LESPSAEAELSAILPSLIGASEFIYSIPISGQSKTAKMYLDEVYPMTDGVSQLGWAAKALLATNSWFSQGQSLGGLTIAELREQDRR
jgi:hypothetical protein